MELSRKCIVFFIFCNVNAAAAIDGENDESVRKGKWFFYPRTVTETVQQRASITHVIASSCVVVPQSLSRCRHARELQLQVTTVPNRRIRIESTKVPNMVVSSTVDPLLAISSSGDHVPFVDNNDTDKKMATATATSRKGLKLSWAEFFGIGEVTVTKTLVRSITAKYYDPNTVYSFNVKGCRPTVLPFNLPLCDNNTNSFGTNSFSQDVHYAP